ncbi:MAG: TIGR00266 family protein [Candidatus Nezhaarchaeota archaeon]|nr:TIGR00266 family protein [Candidatus Nezhaarchaeota archaeon]
MRYEVVGRPSFSTLKVLLEPGEAVTAEAGALLAMEGDVSVETKTAGGVGKGLLRKVAVGETLFINTFRAGPRGATVWLAPSVPGDIHYYELRGDGLVVQDYSYLAHHGDVDYELKWRGLRGLLAEPKSGLVWLRVYGRGGVWLNSYGAIEARELSPGEEVVVDNAHLVAIQDATELSVIKFGGWKSFLFGGEGFVVKVRGPGKVLLQTRTLPALAEALSRFLPSRR